MANICTVTISGTVVQIQEGSLSIKSRVDDKDSCTFTVIDSTGTAAYQKGQPVRVTDSQLGLLFSGFINKPTCTNLYPNATNLWSMDCVNKFVVAAKKAAKPTTGTKRHRGGKHKNQPSGAIAANQIQEYVEPEGVTGNFGLDWSELQTDWSSGVLTGVTGAANTSTGNVGAGDLELAQAGVGMTFMQQNQSDFNAGTTGGGMTATTGGVTLTPASGIMLQTSVLASGFGNPTCAVKIWSNALGSYTIPNNFPKLSYSIWITDSTPQKTIGIDLTFTDGTTLSGLISTDGIIPDQQGISAAPTNDLSGLATNTWYSRTCWLYGNTSLAGKSLAGVTLVSTGSQAGTYTAYFRGITISNYDGSNALTIFSTTATSTAITPQIIQSGGYGNTTCSVVTVYPAIGAMYSPAFSLSNVGIVQSSQVSWVVSLPSSDFVFLATATIDGFATFLPCTSGEAIPNLIAGMSTSGTSLQFVYSMFNNGPNPTLTPVLTSIQGTVISAYACTKNDIVNTTKGNWSAGTLNNLNLSGTNTLQLNGYARNWTDANYANQTLYGSSSPAQGVLTKQFYLTSGTGTDARSEFDFAGNGWQNFTAEVDIVLGPTNTQSCFFYRTSGQTNTNNTFGYCVIVQTAGMVFGYGTNGGANIFTSLKTASLTLSASTTYHLKAVVNGNSHVFYLNDVQIISETDSTYSAAGYVGLRYYNNTGSTQTGYFANFGIMAALSGTWTSPAIDIHSLGSISNSQIILQIDPGTASSIAMFGVAISLNNGTTWSTCPNDLATPVISGADNGQGYFQSLPVPGLSPGTNVSSYTQVRLQITITASTASTGLFMPDVQAISLFVIGAYSSTGTRSTAPLAWDSMIRGNSSGSWGNATNGASYTKTGTGTIALTSDEATISNTTGDVHMQLGAVTQQDTMATCRVALSASTITAGIELRYSDANDFYRLAISTTTVSLVKVSGGISITLASVSMSISIGIFYNIRFIVQGNGVAPVNLSANVWQSGTSEPSTYTISATD